MSDLKPIRWLAAGAALIAAPVAAMRLYHALAGPPDPVVPPGPPLQRGPLRLGILPQIDPALVRYQEVGRVNTHLIEASVIAIARDGTLVVAGDGIVRIIPPDGGPTHSIRADGTITCIAVDDESSIYLGLTDHVAVFAADGAPKATWPVLPRDSFLTGIAVSKEQVFLADSGRRVVVRTDRSGMPLNEIGRPDPARGIPGLVLPSPHLGVALVPDGSIWVNNAGLHRMENYAPDGTLNRFWGKSGTDVDSFAGCCNPTDFWLLSDGSFVTTEKGVARVKHYLPDGRFESVIAAPTSFAPNMTGLGVVAEGNGRVLVLERGTGLVHVFQRIAGGAS